MPDKTKEIKEPKKGNSTSCLYDETKYGYHENKTITLDELEPIINSTFAPNYLALVSDEIRAYG